MTAKLNVPRAAFAKEISPRATALLGRTKTANGADGGSKRIYLSNLNTMFSSSSIRLNFKNGLVTVAIAIASVAETLKPLYISIGSTGLLG
jgi:hypothetical protein